MSPFGSRRIREWIIRPLARPKDITCRLDAVDDLIRETSARFAASNLMLDNGNDLSCSETVSALRYENFLTSVECSLGFMLTRLGGIRRYMYAVLS